MRQQEVQRRGVAVLMVIMLIGVLAVILTSVASHAVAEQRRAADAAEAVQASRLLAAASQIARQQISDAAPHDGPIETPVGRVTFAWRGTETSRQCDVNITVGHTRRAVTLSFNDKRLTAVE